MDVAVRLLLFHEQARVRLSQQRARGAELAQLDELQHHLLVQLHQLLVGQLQGRRSFQHSVPVAIVDVGAEAVHAVHGVQGHARLLLFSRPNKNIFSK